MGTHTTPELWRTVKPMSGGLACWAANTRSPSFSRSSSSTTTTAAPEAMAATASGTGSSRTACATGAAQAARRSAYFASTSTSRFTASPSARAPRVVTRRVSGITPTSNHAGDSPGALTAVTVRDTPSTAIEPLTAM